MPRDLALEAADRLWLLVPLAAVLLAVLAVRRYRRRGAEAFAEPALRASVAPHRLGWRRPVAAAGLALGVVALTAAFARPTVLRDDAQEEAVVAVVLDSSASMNAQDVAPSRWLAAQDAAQAFVRGLPDEVEVALLTYGADAQLVVAPTDDHERVAAAVDGIEMSGGTALGDALQLTVDTLLTELPGRPAATSVVLLGDGDSTVGQPLEEVLPAVATTGVVVDTIAFGTPDGVVVGSDQTYLVPVDTAALAGIAGTTGGTAYTAGSADELAAAYDDVTTAVVAITAREDVADVLAGAGFLLLLSTAVPSLVWDRRLV